MPQVTVQPCHAADKLTGAKRGPLAAIRVKDVRKQAQLIPLAALMSIRRPGGRDTAARCLHLYVANPGAGHANRVVRADAKRGERRFAYQDQLNAERGGDLGEKLLDWRAELVLGTTATVPKLRLDSRPKTRHRCRDLLRQGRRNIHHRKLTQDGIVKFLKEGI